MSGAVRVRSGAAERPRRRDRAHQAARACGAAVLLSLCALTAPTAAGAKTGITAKAGIGAETLFWNQAQREAYFPHMERRFRVHTIARGAHVHPLPPGRPLQLSIPFDGSLQTLDRFMSAQKTAGLMVLQDGRVRLERYGLGYGPAARWTSFSVAKSMTSTLVGAAVKDGYIRSLDDPVTRYISALRGSAYEGVSIRQVLTMTSGVRWNENYADPKSDVAQLFSTTPEPGLDPTVSYMRKLPREASPGTKWVYKTGETNLIGVLVAQATGKTLTDYLSEKIWRPYGMAQDGVWMIDQLDHEPGGCCLSAALGDYARFGQFILDGGVAQGRHVLPDGWLAAATRKQADIGKPGRGYGFQWWTKDDGAFDAEGIFGQAIHIDPKRRLVVVLSSAWSQADPPEGWAAQRALFAAVAAAVDAEADRPTQPQAPPAIP